MLVIGLTGGIASGKSTVSQILKDLGATILDADKIGHEAYLPDTQTWKDVVTTFGEDILRPDREIDRAKLGALVFQGKENMKKLTDIMWPRMYDMVSERIEKQRSLGAEVMVVEAAVLFEAKWYPLADEVWVTVANERSVIERLIENKGLNEQQAQARIDAQMSTEERIKRSDVVINNDSGYNELGKTVIDIWKNRVDNRK